MRPKPIVIKIGDKEYGLLLTLKAVEEIQSNLGIPISEVLTLLDDYKSFEIVLSALADIGKIKIYPEDIPMLKNKILFALILGMPKREEDEIPITKEPSKFPVARALYIGTTVLGFPEKEVWNMTLRKLLLLYTEHRKETGTYKPPATIDDVIPL